MAPHHRTSPDIILITVQAPHITGHHRKTLPVLNDGALAVARYMGAVLVCITLEPHRRPASQQTSLLATGDQDRQWTSSCSSLRHSNATSISTRVQSPSPRWAAAESTPSHGILILGRVPVPSRSWTSQQEPKSRDVSFMLVVKRKCRCTSTWKELPSFTPKSWPLLSPAPPS